MYESVRAGKIVFEKSLDTLSEGTSGGIEENSVLLCIFCYEKIICVSVYFIHCYFPFVLLFTADNIPAMC